MPYHTFVSSLFFLLSRFLSFFLSFAYPFCFFSFSFLFLSMFLFFLIFPFSSVVSHCAQLRLFYIFCRDKIYFGLLWVPFPGHPLVCWLPNHHHYTVLAVPRSILRQKGIFFLFFLLSVAFPSR